MRSTWQQFSRALGYGVVLLPPALLAFAAHVDKPYLVFGIVMLLFPLSRLVFGAVAPGSTSTWQPWLAAAMDRLPMIYVLTLSLALGLWMSYLGSGDARPSVADCLGWALSLWMVLIFATCVAHALLHASSATQRLLGHVLAGVSGYPVLGYEHVRHHRLSGNTSAAEWPRVDESVWRFAGRRLGHIATETMAPGGLAIKGNPKSSSVRGLRLSLACTATTAGIFGLAMDVVGMVIYGISVALVSFTIQLVTYMQHWGLGDDNIDEARVHGYGWDSDCQFQAWLTLGLSLHQAHHREGARPYYESHLVADSPRHPAGYMLLMLAAFSPSLWNRVMRPALMQWRKAPQLQPSAGRKLTCIAQYPASK